MLPLPERKDTSMPPRSTAPAASFDPEDGAPQAPVITEDTSQSPQSRWYREQYIRCGKHDAAIESLVGDSRRHSQEIAELFALARQTAESVSSIAASLATMVTIAQEDHITVQTLRNDANTQQGCRSTWKVVGTTLLVMLGWAVAFICAWWGKLAPHTK